MSDARNMGLSISMQALAEQPEMVIAKTAKTLGVSVATAAKILTSVGMSILMTNGQSSDVEHSDRENGQKAHRQKRTQAKDVLVSSTQAPPQPVANANVASDSQYRQPVLGSFQPNGDADLCVVVGQSELPAPSPFSARKRRRPHAFVSGDPMCTR